MLFFSLRALDCKASLSAKFTSRGSSLLYNAWQCACVPLHQFVCPRLPNWAAKSKDIQARYVYLKFTQGTELTTLTFYAAVGSWCQSPTRAALLTSTDIRPERSQKTRKTGWNKSSFSQVLIHKAITVSRVNLLAWQTDLIAKAVKGFKSFWCG